MSAQKKTGTPFLLFPIDATVRSEFSHYLTTDRHTTILVLLKLFCFMLLLPSDLKQKTIRTPLPFHKIFQG